ARWAASRLPGGGMTAADDERSQHRHPPESALLWIALGHRVEGPDLAALRAPRECGGAPRHRQDAGAHARPGQPLRPSGDGLARRDPHRVLPRSPRRRHQPRGGGPVRGRSRRATRKVARVVRGQRSHAVLRGAGPLPRGPSPRARGGPDYRGALVLGAMTALLTDRHGPVHPIRCYGSARGGGVAGRTLFLGSSYRLRFFRAFSWGPLAAETPSVQGRQGAMPVLRRTARSSARAHPANRLPALAQAWRRRGPKLATQTAKASGHASGVRRRRTRAVARRTARPTMTQPGSALPTPPARDSTARQACPARPAPIVEARGARGSMRAATVSRIP